MANTTLPILADVTRPTSNALPGMVQLPNLLSLDAPAVAVSWHGLLAVACRPVTADGPTGFSELVANLPATAVLFSTVWLIYMGDRLLDCRRLDFNQEVALRHRFVQRWSGILWPTWTAIFAATGLAAALLLDERVLISGLYLFGLVLLYGWAVHGSAALRKHLPKELIVGTIFAIGISLPTACHHLSTSLVVSTAVLAGLCIVNCLCAAQAQRASDWQQGLTSAILLFPRLSRRLPSLAAGAVGVSVVVTYLGLVPWRIAAAAITSGLGLMMIAWLLQRDVDWLNRDGCGQLADYALLSPLFLLATCG